MSNTNEDILGSAPSRDHAAVKSIAGAADQAARRIRPGIDGIAAMARKAAEKAARAAAPTAEWLAEQGDTLDSKQNKMFSNVSDYISANPLKAVGMAVVAGFVLSRVVHRHARVFIP